jgi:hypothetical protein
MDEIEQELGRSIDWNRARVKFLARFLVALISVRTVCLTQIASAFPGCADKESHYRRIQRFFADFALDYQMVARLVSAWARVPAPWVLAMDRTNWKLGRTEVNVLMLALVHEGIAFPLFWTLLPKAGASNTAERIALLERFVHTFGKERLGYILADREFASEGLLAWLVRERISFRLRIKSDTLVSNRKGYDAPSCHFFQNCPREMERQLPGRRWCLGQQVYVSGTRMGEDKRDEFLIVLSSEPAPLCDYALRWGVETLFGALKTRGFCLEATHLVLSDRLEKLLALLAMAFCWAFACGAWLAKETPTRIKKHGRPAISAFRRGLDWLSRQLMPLCGGSDHNDFTRAVRFLSCT